MSGNLRSSLTASDYRTIGRGLVDEGVYSGRVILSNSEFELKLKHQVPFPTGYL